MQLSLPPSLIPLLLSFTLFFFPLFPACFSQLLPWGPRLGEGGKRLRGEGSCLCGMERGSSGMSTPIPGGKALLSALGGTAVSGEVWGKGTATFEFVCSKAGFKSG